MDEFSMTMMIENGGWRVLFLKRAGYDIQIRINDSNFQRNMTIVYYILTK